MISIRPTLFEILQATRLVLFVICAVLAWDSFANAIAQDGNSEDETLASSRPSLSEATTEIWEVGIKITAQANSTGIRGFFAVPVEWTEQKISILGQAVSANVTKARMGREEDNVQWMTMEVPQLAAGDTASVIVRMELQKSNIAAPTDPSSLVFSKKPPKEAKKWLLPSPQIESRNKKIRELADSLEIDETLPAWNQVETVYDWVRDNIEYKFEAKNRSCLECLESRMGDCGEMTGLFIAICRARGIPARAVWIPDHTYPEFYLEDAEGNGHWFPCQAAGTRQFGEMQESRIILQKGDRFRVPGNRDELRYLQPTMEAASGGVAMEFVHRTVNTDVEVSSGK